MLSPLRSSPAFVVRAALMAGLVGLLIPGAADAQPSEGQRLQAAESVQAPLPRSRPSVEFRAYFLVESSSLAAADTFDAVIGRSRLSMAGGGGELLNIWKGLFARVAFSSAEAIGSRVVVFGEDVIPLGIPVTVRMRPFEIAGGWRMSALASGRVIPYAGAGLLSMGYRESSEFGTREDNTNETFSGVVVFGGIDATIFRWVFAGAELQYRTVPNALGHGGVSEVLGETNLGGAVVRMLVGIRR